MIRKAELRDIPALVDLSIEALSIDAYNELVISQERVTEQVVDLISGIQHFAWVSEVGGKVQGGLGVMVAQSPVYERNQASIFMWYCKAPGDGMRLMRKFREWLAMRPLIKQVFYVGERNADPRIAKLVKKSGFGEVLPMYLMTR